MTQEKLSKLTPEQLGYALIDSVFAFNINENEFIDNIEQIKLIINAGADINYQDKYGRTPLICAARISKIETFKYLLNKGADPFILAGSEDFIEYSDNRANKNALFHWLKTYDAQKYILDKHPKIYFMFKKHKMLNTKIKKEYSYLTTVNDLNLL